MKPQNQQTTEPRGTQEYVPEGPRSKPNARRRVGGEGTSRSPRQDLPCSIMQKYKAYRSASPMGSPEVLIGSSSSPLSRHPSLPLRPRCEGKRVNNAMASRVGERFDGRGLINARSGTLTNDHLQPRISSVSPAVNFRQQNSEAALDVLLGERVGYADGERVVVQMHRYDPLEPYP
jgi:hypothetical protein